MLSLRSPWVVKPSSSRAAWSTGAARRMLAAEFFPPAARLAQLRVNAGCRVTAVTLARVATSLRVPLRLSVVADTASWATGRCSVAVRSNLSSVAATRSAGGVVVPVVVRSQLAGAAVLRSAATVPVRARASATVQASPAGRAVTLGLTSAVRVTLRGRVVPPAIVGLVDWSRALAPVLDVDRALAPVLVANRALAPVFNVDRALAPVLVVNRALAPLLEWDVSAWDRDDG
jgi:hypothetical protein